MLNTHQTEFHRRSLYDTWINYDKILFPRVFDYMDETLYNWLWILLITRLLDARTNGEKLIEATRE